MWPRPITRVSCAGRLPTRAGWLGSACRCHVGPDAVDQLALKDCLPGAFNQGDQISNARLPNRTGLSSLSSSRSAGYSRNRPKAKTVLSTGRAVLVIGLIAASFGNSPRKVNLLPAMRKAMTGSGATLPFSRALAKDRSPPRADLQRG